MSGKHATTQYRDSMPGRQYQTMSWNNAFYCVSKSQLCYPVHHEWSNNAVYWWYVVCWRCCQVTGDAGAGPCVTGWTEGTLRVNTIPILSVVVEGLSVRPPVCLSRWGAGMGRNITMALHSMQQKINHFQPQFWITNICAAYTEISGTKGFGTAQPETMDPENAHVIILVMYLYLGQSTIFCHSYSNSMEILCCSYPNPHNDVDTKFCTWQLCCRGMCETLLH